MLYKFFHTFCIELERSGEGPGSRDSAPDAEAVVRGKEECGAVDGVEVPSHVDASRRNIPLYRVVSTLLRLKKSEGSEFRKSRLVVVCQQLSYYTLQRQEL